MESENQTTDSKNQIEKSYATNDTGIASILFSFCKKAAFVGAIYLVGYCNWSVAWLIGPVILTTAREHMRKSADFRRNIAKASALNNEKDVILARIDELPAWVYFPDIERCEWVNKILQQLWPKANYYARDLVKTVIEPNVTKALSKYKLGGFKFDRIILGTIPPRIGGVKVYDKNVSRNEITMDMDLFYASDCDINFTLRGMRGGIKDFQIHGMVRVVMKPLITKMPLVGGLQIFFLNNPNIDFNLVGVVDLLDMPGLSDMLRKVIVEQIAAIMVLPNKLPITLSDTVVPEMIKMPEPEGVLRIHVVGAKDLMRKDIGVLGKGKSDPYAIVTVGAEQFKTHTIDNTVNPKWDYWCETVILSGKGQSLNIQLFDKDDTSDDENLGRAKVEIEDVIKNGVLDSWITLEEARHGLVHLRLTWFSLTKSGSDLQAALEDIRNLRVMSMSTAVLSAYIDSAANLPEARTASKPDPYLTITVGKQSEQTQVVMRNDSPVWEQGYTFLLPNPMNDVMRINIVDQKTGTELGQLNYNLAELLEKPDLQISLQPLQLKKSGPDSNIVISLALRILKNPETSADSGIVEVSSKLSSSSAAINDIERISVSSDQSPRTPVVVGPNTPEVQEEIIRPTDASMIFAGNEIEHNAETQLRQRRPSLSTGVAGLGRIQLTLRYSLQRQRLIVIVHKICNIPLKDPSNVPDPYVKLYLLPARSKESKRKTNVIKDDCNPVYDSTFEYVISAMELLATSLEVTVASQKGFLSGGSPVIGLVEIPLRSVETSPQGITAWYDLLEENK